MTNEIDANRVIASLQEQIAALALDKAVLSAHIEALQSAQTEQKE